MLLEPISKDGKPQGKCFAKKCSDCAWYRKWEVTNTTTRKKSIDSKCSFEALLYTLPDLVGAVDGVQQATNETRNRTVECIGLVAKRTEQFVGSIKFIADQTKRIGE